MNIKAYAKINLSLALTGVREDGYHTLHSVMQTVSLCDMLSVELAETTVFTCSEPSLSGDKNLCVKAANAFFGQTGLQGGAKVHLEKHIPTGAGLGGGSADAAAVLRALNTLHGEPLTQTELLALSAKLGADVPFCLHGGKCLCTGIGEVFTPMPTEPLHLVIAKGADGLSTPDMYRRMDAVRDTWSSADRTGYFNDFEPVAEAALPDIAYLKKRLTKLGAHVSMMSGSGSAVFGIFETEEQAETAAQTISAEGYFAENCVTIEKITE